MWKATSLGGSAVSLAQLIAARTLFTRDQLIASCPENESLRFLAFPIFLPSAVGDLDDVKKQGANSVELTEIPLCAGHATVMGWYDCMAAALSATKRYRDYIRHLYVVRPVVVEVVVVVVVVVGVVVVVAVVGR